MSDGEADKVRRIGVIGVHGIGDQPPLGYMEAVMRNLSSAADKLYGRANVTMGLRQSDQDLHDGRLIVRADAGSKLPSCEIYFHEVWWRDLGISPTFSQLLLFWWWAISVPGAPGLYEKDRNAQNIIALKNTEACRRSISWRVRAELFLKVSFFFIMLAPLNIVLQLVMIIPGLPKFSVFRKIFAYASSIQLYTAGAMRGSNPASDHRRPARISIQRRLIDRMLRVSHEEQYDAWYIFGHSLGSVIATQALFHDNVAYARYAPPEMKERLEIQPVSDQSAHDVDPRYEMDAFRPAWLDAEHELPAENLFAKFGGLVTYGSPIELFARAWPAALCVAKGRFPFGKAGTKAEWLNFVDPKDVIAARINSFTDAHGLVPQNITVAVGEHVANSHSKYFAPLKPRSPTAEALVHWLVTGGSFKDSQQVCELTSLAPDLERRHRNRGFLQWVIVLIAGVIIWPSASHAIEGLARSLIETIKHLDIVEFYSALSDYVLARDWKSAAGLAIEYFTVALYGIAGTVGIVLLASIVLSVVRAWSSSRRR
jgi:hypothetical protein